MKARLFLAATLAALAPSAASAHPGHVLPHGSDLLAALMLAAFALLVAGRTARTLPAMLRRIARRG